MATIDVNLVSTSGIASLSKNNAEKANLQSQNTTIHKKFKLKTSAKSLLSDDDTHDISEAENVANVINHGSILAIQELDDQENHKKAIKEYGQNAIRALGDLQIELLYGNISLETLRNLQKLAQDNIRKTSIDEVKNILETIEARILVEIAKVEKM